MKLFDYCIIFDAACLNETVFQERWNWLYLAFFSVFFILKITNFSRYCFHADPVDWFSPLCVSTMCPPRNMCSCNNKGMQKWKTFHIINNSVYYKIVISLSLSPSRTFLSFYSMASATVSNISFQFEQVFRTQ